MFNKFFGRTNLVKVALAAFIIATLMGPGATTHSVKADDGVTSIVLSMDEYHFTVEGKEANAAIEFKAGTAYSLTLKNTGKLAHEIWWGKEPQMQEGRLDGYKTNLFEGLEMSLLVTQAGATDPIEVVTYGISEVALQPGQEVTLEFVLPDSAKGAWEIGCFQPMPKATSMTMEANATAAPDVPHYAVGMKVDVTVD